MMDKLSNTRNSENDAFKNAHILSEFSKVLQNIGTDMEKSVTLFDSIGEKNELFKKFEKSLSSPIDSFMEMNKISSNQVYEYVFRYFVAIFSEYTDKFNFVHVGKASRSEIIFFISTKDDEIKEILSKNEFEYATSDLSSILDISFCFLEKDMEKDLFNTKKIDLNND